MEQNPMPWFEIYVEDMKRARKFYEGLLDVELNLEDMPGGEIRCICFPVKWRCQGQLVH